jgi:hypothetical protein
VSLRAAARPLLVAASAAIVAGATLGCDFKATLPPPTEADVIVYGGTASGVMAAVAAAREGASVVVVEPGRNLGGMVGNGLSATDVVDRDLVGGLPAEFFERVEATYGPDQAATASRWRLEPHVAQSTFLALAREAGVTVAFGEALREGNGVAVGDGRVLSITTTTGTVYRGRVFVDASYEGDLMAQAGVATTWGRESRSQYGESLAGIGAPPDDASAAGVPAYSGDGTLLPGVSAEPHGTTGDADRSLQAYTYRLCVSEDPANQIAFTAPTGYDPARYRLELRSLQTRASKQNREPALRDVLTLVPLPNRKWDVNSDYVGGNRDYPVASYADRARMAADTHAYLQGLVYFLSQDPDVAPSVRAELAGLGYCKDEFVDNGAWPPLIYVRESRRMVGRYVLTQADTQVALVKPDSVGLGQYRIDSHNVRRLVSADGYAYGEGGLAAPISPYEIPYRSLLPAAGSVSNLVVTVDVSASHVAWSSLRMEPQFMIMGQAGGTAAAMALARDGDVSAVDASGLQDRLRRAGAVLSTTQAVRAVLSTGSEPAIAGSPTRVIVEMHDGLGRAATGYRGTIHFTSTDVSAVLPADYTFTEADAGRHEFSVTFPKPGTQALRVRDTIQPSLTGRLSDVKIGTVGAPARRPAAVVAACPRPRQEEIG